MFAACLLPAPTFAGDNTHFVLRDASSGLLSPSGLPFCARHIALLSAYFTAFSVCALLTFCLRLLLFPAAWVLYIL